MLTFTYSGKTRNSYRQPDGRMNEDVLRRHAGSGEFRMADDGMSLSGFTIPKGSTSRKSGSPTRNADSPQSHSFNGRWDVDGRSEYFEFTQKAEIRKTPLLMLHATQGEPAVAWGDGKVMYPEARYVPRHVDGAAS